MLDNIRCEVLNLTYEPLATVTARRATRLILKGKATLLEEHPTLMYRTATTVYPVPIRIVLRTMVKSRNSHTIAVLNRRNLLLRDRFTCQYCGRHENELAPKEKMTRDHIHPQDKGGRDTWDNLVLACDSCNNKKANRLLEQTDMKLRKAPYRPTSFEIAMRARYEKERRSGK